MNEFIYCHRLLSYTYVGRGGATIRSMAEESGAKISMTAKEESIFTHERYVCIMYSHIYIHTYIYIYICMYIYIKKYVYSAKISLIEYHHYHLKRILSISGGKSGCAKCLGMVVAKLAEVYKLNRCIFIYISKYICWNGHIYIYMHLYMNSIYVSMC
jgi:hypothetical protein